MQKLRFLKEIYFFNKIILLKQTKVRLLELTSAQL